MVMDPSPTPPRRFSRWKTTKRNFVFGDVANHSKPKVQKLSNVQEQSQHKGPKYEALPALPKLSSYEPFKFHEKSALHDLQLGTNIDLNDDPHRDQCTTNAVSHPVDDALSTINGVGVEGEGQLPDNELSHPDDVNAPIDDGRPRVSKSLQKNSSMHQISQKLSSSHGKTIDQDTADKTVENLGQGDICDTSAHHLTDNSSTLKRAVVQNGSSSINKTAMSKHKKSVKEAKTKHRLVSDLDREDSTESSSTDKENKSDKIEDSLVRRQKKDEFIGSLQLSSVPDEGPVLNLSKRNHGMAPLPEGHDSSSVKLSSLRNRDLLTPAETLRKKRQYPYSLQSRKKSISPKKDVLHSKQMSGDGSSSGHSLISQQKTQKPKREKKTKLSQKQSPLKPEVAVQKLPTQEPSNSLGRERENLPKATDRDSSRPSPLSFSTPDHMTMQPAQDSQTSSGKENPRSRSLRDRSLMRSPESVQKMRQYPISFYYSRKKMLEISGEVSPDQSANVSKQNGRSPAPTKHSPVKGKQKKSEIKTAAKFSGNNSNRSQPVVSLPSASFKKSVQKQGIRKSLTLSRGVKYSISDSVLVAGALSSQKDCSGAHLSQREEQLDWRKQKVSGTKVKQKSKAIATHNVAVSVHNVATGNHNAAVSAHNVATATHNAAVSAHNVATGNHNAAVVPDHRTATQADSFHSPSKSPLGKTSGLNMSLVKNGELMVGPIGSLIEKNKSNGQIISSPMKKNKSSLIQSRSLMGNDKSSSHSRSPLGENKSSDIESRSPLGKKNSSVIQSRSPLGKNKSSIFQSRSLLGNNKSSSQSRSPLGKNKSSVIQSRSPLKKNKSSGIKSMPPLAKSKSPQKLQHLEKNKASVTVNDVSINSTILSSQKTQRKRNLVTELTTILEGEKAAKGCGRKIKLWCPDGNSRPGSDVTAFDVILEDIEILEDNLRSAEENDAGKRLVGRVMRGLKQSVTTRISKVLEVKDLETGLKKQKVRNKKLLTDLTDLEKQKQKLRGEMQAIGKDNHHKNIMLANSWMNDFRQLVMTVDDESGDG